MFWAVSCLYWSGFSASYSLDICGLWHTILLWLAHPGLAHLFCNVESAPEKLCYWSSREFPQPPSSNKCLPIPCFTQLLMHVSQTWYWLHMSVNDLERWNAVVGLWSTIFGILGVWGHRCWQKVSLDDIWSCGICHVASKCLEICCLL